MHTHRLDFIDNLQQICNNNNEDSNQFINLSQSPNMTVVLIDVLNDNDHLLNNSSRDLER